MLQENFKYQGFQMYLESYEIYNKHIYDLLAVNNKKRKIVGDKPTRNSLEYFQNREELTIRGLSRKLIKSKEPLKYLELI